VGKALSVKLPGKTGKHALHEIVGIRMPPLQVRQTLSTFRRRAQ
jgi:hypothetical protein